MKQELPEHKSSNFLDKNQMNHTLKILTSLHAVGRESTMTKINIHL